MKKYSVLFKDMDKHYECLLGTLPCIVYTLDEKGHFTYLSDSAPTALGFSREELLGRHFSYVIHPHDLPDISREFLLPQFMGMPTGNDRAPKLFDERRSWPRRTTGLDVRLNRKASGSDDPILQCRVNASGQYDDQKRFCGTVGVIYDFVTEAANPVLMKKRKGYNPFELLIRALSHVFSNVFTGIYGNIQLIEMQIGKSEPFADNITAIKQSIESAVSLIKKISGTVGERERCSGSLLNSILIDQAKEFLESAGFTYTVESDDTLRSPDLDADYVRHIVRAVFFHILQSVTHDTVVGIKAKNVVESPVKLPRIDCAYINVCFSFSTSQNKQALDTTEGFLAAERVASMALSYELLKRVGGCITADGGKGECIIDLYLPVLCTIPPNLME